MLKSAAEFAIRRPRTVLAAWLLVLLVGFGAGTGVFAKLGGLGGNVPGSQSQTAADRIDALDPGTDVITGLVATTVPGRVITADPAVRAQVASAVTALRAIPGVVSVPDPFGPPGASGASGASAPAGDGQVVAIQVAFSPTLSNDDEETAILASEARLRDIAAPGVVVRVGGGPLTGMAMNDTAKNDAAKAEILSLPIVLVLLLLIFGGFLAAALPLILAFCGIAATLLTLLVFSHFTSLSTYSIQITTMLGLGLGVDYALLIVTRFREERARTPEKRDVKDCVRRTVAGAGRTVFFSGLTVAVSLAGIVVYPAPFLRSLGLASMSVVAVDMLAAVTILPALLGKYGHRIAPAKAARGAEADDGRRFARIAAAVVKRPLPILLCLGAALLTLAAPAASLTMSTGDARELPKSSEARQVYDLSLAHFPGHSNADPVDVLVPGGASRPGYLEHLRSLPGVVASTQKTFPDGSAVVYLTPSGTDDGPVALGLVDTIRAENQGAEVTGASARLIDFRHMLSSRLPYAAAVVLLSVFVLLFLFTGSVLIPLKAVLANLLSIGAAVGGVVWVFQEGHLAGALGSQGIGALDIVVPPLMIAVAFGLSMDYEIFILGRIREARLAGESAREAVVTGVGRTGRVVTCAALLLVVVFACFMTGGSAPILEFGLGLTLAVLIDATLVRMLLVPAAMALLGERAWWAPAPLRRLHDRFGIREDAGPATVTETGAEAEADRIEAQAYSPTL